MLFKKIKLNNIRSYENEEIDFSRGSTLLSGDIGSGKTSILLAIEFALFGLQPGQRGTSLLRNGKNKGGVEMVFEIEGKDVLIERSLKKAKTVSQDYCAITIENEKKEVSVTELKNKILELLNYPKEFTKKQNLLYKFTVYTQQEEMKQIILQDPETRINTLRHVFGIDKYKKVLENVSIVASKIREEKRMKEGITANLDQDKADIVVKEDDLETKHSNLSSIEKEFFLRKEERKKIQEEQSGISEKIQEKKELEQEVEKIKIRALNKQESISNNLKLIDRLNKEVEEIDEKKFEESQIPRLEEDLDLLKKQKEELNEKNLNLTTQINSLALKNQENESLKMKISTIDICPTCLQDVDSVYKSNVVNKFDSDTSNNVKQIEELALEKKLVRENINKLDNELFEKEKQLGDSKILKIRIQGIQEKKKQIEEIIETNQLFEKDIASLTQQIDSLKNSIFELSKFDNIFEVKQRELDEALKQERIVEIKIAELKKEIEVFSKQIEELKERIKKTEEVRKQLNYLNELENWLSKKFSTLISFIEKNVMVKLKSEFSKLFAEWFAMLVSDNFNVMLRDDFTPVVEHQDYEIDYSYLSGGERTAIALAYRLALNQVINSLLSKIMTKGIVILDEPTDGFSEQQLDKMREVLEQLKVEQLIIVSHEPKIEGFVENVVRFKKEDGISRKVS